MKNNKHSICYQFVINLDLIPNISYALLEFNLVPLINIDDAETLPIKIFEKLSSIFINSNWSLLSSEIIINDKNEKFLKILYSSELSIISLNKFQYILDTKFSKNFEINIREFNDVILRDVYLENSQALRIKTLSNISAECNEYSKITGNNWIISKVFFEPIQAANFIVNGININVNYDDVFKNSHKYIKVNSVSYIVKVCLMCLIY